MSGLTGDIKKLFNFKYKSRNDSVTDQLNRVYMSRAMLVAAFICGMSWYTDVITCLVPPFVKNDNLKHFVPKACWINGFYVYEDLLEKSDFQGYYGLPMAVSHNGTMGKNEITCEASYGQKLCKPMQKRFYLHFQWFPFYLAACSLLFYLPYLLFNAVNEDLDSLKNRLSEQKPDTVEIVKYYFDSTVNPKQKQYFKLLMNLLVKIGYLLANILIFSFTNSLLNGKFLTYGSRWLEWSELPNPTMYNYVGKRDVIKAGESILPTFGYCDVLEVGMDIKHTVYNTHQFICEMSQHVLYQYVLVALWFLIVVALIASIVGLMLQLVLYYLPYMSFTAEKDSRESTAYSNVTIRQREYLNLAYKNNQLFYRELINILVDGPPTPQQGDDDCEECLGQQGILMQSLKKLNPKKK